MSDEHYGILIESDRDRRTLDWLRRIKTTDEIAAAALAVAGSGRRVYVSNVVRQLGLTDVVKLARLEQEPAAPRPEPGPEAAAAREKLKLLAQEYRAGRANKRI